MSAEVIRLPDRAFALGWEQKPGIDECAHEWETLFAESRPEHFVEVDRCAKCGVPRCGDPNNPDPCQERRHHSGLHIYPSGRFYPLGGYLSGEGAP